MDLAAAQQAQDFDIDGRCGDCRYSLRGLTVPRCPECGRPFDPADPDTYLQGSQRRVLDPIERRLLTPPALRVKVGFVLVTLTTLYVYAFPGLTGAVQAVLTVVTGILTLMCLIRILFQSLIVIRCNPPARWRKPTWPWYRLTAWCLLTVLACTIDAPLWAGFALSRSSLDRLVARATASPTTQPLTDRVVGIYPVRKIRRIDGGVHIEVLMTGRGNSGFVYFYTAPPAQHSPTEYGGLWGGWLTYQDWHNIADRKLWWERLVFTWPEPHCR